jgi:hypothetical protein
MKRFSSCGLSIILLLITVMAHAQGQPQKQLLVYNAQIIDVVTGKIKKENALLIEGPTNKSPGKFQPVK